MVAGLVVVAGGVGFGSAWMLILLWFPAEPVGPVAFQGLAQDLIHELGHGEFPASGLVVEKAHEITPDHRGIVVWSWHINYL